MSRPDIYLELDEIRARLQALETGKSPAIGLTVPQRVILAACKASGVAREVILGRSRKAPATKARGLVIRLLRDNGYTVEEIGKLVQRDHSTVLYHLRKRAPAELLARAERLLGGGSYCHEALGEGKE